MSGIIQGIIASNKRPSGTITFVNGTSSWTVPASVTKLITISGRGADGAAAYTYVDGTQVDWAGIGSAGNGTGDYTDWSTIYSLHQSAVNNYNSLAPGSYFGPYTGFYHFVGTGNNLLRTDVSGNIFNQVASGYKPSGGYTAFVSQQGSAATSGTIAFDTNGVWRGIFYYNVDVPATTGDSSTISQLSLTFLGGTGGAASTTVFNNVSVTPGQTLTIVNKSNTSLSIVY
jgi:hypothetical protein